MSTTVPLTKDQLTTFVSPPKSSDFNRRKNAKSRVPQSSTPSSLPTPDREKEKSHDLESGGIISRFVASLEYFVCPLNLNCRNYTDPIVARTKYFRDSVVMTCATCFAGFIWCFTKINFNYLYIGAVFVVIGGYSFARPTKSNLFRKDAILMQRGGFWLVFIILLGIWIYGHLYL
jgi:hypothetical protein